MVRTQATLARLWLRLSHDRCTHSKFTKKSGHIQSAEVYRAANFTTQGKISTPNALIRNYKRMAAETHTYQRYWSIHIQTHTVQRNQMMTLSFHITPPYCVSFVIAVQYFQVERHRAREPSQQSVFFYIKKLIFFIRCFYIYSGKEEEIFGAKRESRWNKLSSILILLRVSASVNHFIISIKMARLHCI